MFNDWRDFYNQAVNDAVNQSSQNVLSAMDTQMALQGRGTPQAAPLKGYYDIDGNFTEYLSYGDTYGSGKTFAP